MEKETGCSTLIFECVLLLSAIFDCSSVTLTWKSMEQLVPYYLDGSFYFFCEHSCAVYR